MTTLAAAASSRPGLWVRAARPRTLTIAVAPIIPAVALAWRQFGVVQWTPVIAALIAAFAIQIATNLFNDAADGARGADGPGRIGPDRMTALGLISAESVRRAGLLMFALAALAGGVCILHGGWPILLIGLASLAAGYAYSNGPRPISYTPLGEVFVIAFFGVAAVAGTVWLAAGRESLTALLLGVAVGLPAAGVLMVNNHRDRVADRSNGRRTLAIVLGPAASGHVYAATLLLPPVIVAALADVRTSAGLLLPLLLILPAILLTRRFRRLPVGPGLNRLLGLTAFYQLAFSVLTAIGVLL